MVTILVDIILVIVGIFLGLSIGVQAVTNHLVANNRLTMNEARWYYSIINLIKIYYDL